MAAVGVAAVFGAGPSAAAPVSRTLHYTCSSSVIAVTADITIDADAPTSLEVGRPSPRFTVRGTARVDESFARYAGIIGATKVDGSVVARGTMAAPQGDIPQDVPLSIATTAIPASGSFTLTATGTAPSVTLGRPGPAKITIQGFTVQVTPRTASGEPTFIGTIAGACSLNPGQDNVLQSLTVTAPPAPSPPAPGPADTGHPAPPTTKPSGTKSASRPGGSGATGGGPGTTGGSGTQDASGGPGPSTASGAAVPSDGPGEPSPSGSATPTPTPSTPDATNTPTASPLSKPSDGAPIGTASVELPAEHRHFPYPYLIAAAALAATGAAGLFAWIRKRRRGPAAPTHGHVGEVVAAENTGPDAKRQEDR
ncbi:DUF6801 domain-containing protein [Kitasatospora brasiliensis]|uniref:DUF6801 domain-containing protein n=1 Tax=Kitasatospora brasiliensis TaxID=3058040 RepID=UPI002930E63D|nr:DUF6801 domain-containing protein [Kitasatospora sp. K002]